MTTADRIKKLRRMAEHPTTNKHEAANARAEIDRLISLEHKRIVGFVSDAKYSYQLPGVITVPRKIGKVK